MRKSRQFLCVAAGMMLLGSAAAGQNVSTKVKTAAFLETVAAKGAECELLSPWQAAALRALNQQDMQRWTAEQREAAVEEAMRRLAETPCDDPAMTTWIEGARPGFDREMLPPYLIAYRTLVGYEDPPKIFTRTTVRLRYGPAVEAINKKLEEIEASGAPAEGGKPWPEYTERTAEFVRGFVATLANEDAPLAEREEAAVWLAQTAHIVELWLLENEE